MASNQTESAIDVSGCDHTWHDKAQVSGRAWAVIWGLAVASRIIAAVILPNAEQDGYSYAELIADLSRRLGSGDFRIPNLFGFWLPLFQVSTAVLNLCLHNALAAGKIVNALCGATACVLVFSLTRQLTRSLVLAGMMFGLIVLNPLHILYSAACMTDVPFGCVVLASLFFALKEQWLAATVFAALAEGLRIEAWALLIAIPVIVQVKAGWRSSLVMFAILAIPPLAWFGINYLATGNPFAYFAERARYQANYLDFHPTRHGFAFPDIYEDCWNFFCGANPAVICAFVVAGLVLLWQALRHSRRVTPAAAIIAVYACALTGLLFFVYVTKRQPVLLPRYGLCLFALGLPLLAWVLQLNWQTGSRVCFGAFSALILFLYLWPLKPQTAIVAKVLDDFSAHRRITAAFDRALTNLGSNFRCFSDDVAIRVMAAQPPDRFLRSQIVPPFAAATRNAFESYLDEHDVKLLVFIRTEDSLPVKFFPDLGTTKDTAEPNFERLAVARSSFGPDIWLYWRSRLPKTP